MSHLNPEYKKWRRNVTKGCKMTDEERTLSIQAFHHAWNLQQKKIDDLEWDIERIHLGGTP